MRGVLLVVLLWTALDPVGCLFGQDRDSKPSVSDQPIVERPFRRIFVPQADLPESQLDNLRPLEVDKLPAALEGVVKRNTESMDPLLATKQSLYSFHAVAQLIGADLLSERTRLVWDQSSSGTSIGSFEGQIRERLDPWNLAIESVLEESNSSPVWLYDSNGRPYLQRNSNTNWIRWSLRAAPDSAPNLLSYEVQVPKTVDSCLILLVPKTAKLNSADVVVRKLDGWESAAKRFGSWPDQNPALGTSLVSTVESSYWSLEMSGKETISFTIELGQGSARGLFLDLPKQWGVDRLFSKQTLQYSVHSQELRVLSEWEWIESSSGGQPIRLELPEGMKLRSISINDREATVALNDKMIDVSIPELPQDNFIASGAKLRMNAEFITSLSLLQNGTAGGTILPAIMTTNGTVLTGTTILQDQIDGRFVGIAPVHGSMESVRKSSDGLHRFEYSWHRNAPDIHCYVQKPTMRSGLESVAGIRVESNRCVANVRLRCISPKVIGEEFLSLPLGWTIDPKSIINKPPSSLEIGIFDENTNRLKISGARASSAEATIEFQISKSLDATAELDLSNQPWISLSNHEIRHCLFVEPDVSNRLSFRGQTTQWLIPEEELTYWQRESLPRLSRALLFGTQGNRLPPLVISSIEQKLTIPIDTQVRHTNNQWRVEHRFGLSSDWIDVPQIRISLPEGFEWHYESTERLPVIHHFDRQSSHWVIDTRNLVNHSDKEQFGYLVAVRTQASIETQLDLDIPEIDLAQQTFYKLKLFDRLLLKSDTQITGALQRDNSGYCYRWTSSAPAKIPAEEKKGQRLSLEVNKFQESAVRSIYPYDSSLELFIDAFANQMAEIKTRLVLSESHSNELILDLPAGWKVTDCFFENGKNKQRIPWFSDSTSSTKLVIGSIGEFSAPFIHIRLVGPPAQIEEETSLSLPSWLRPRFHRKLRLSSPSVSFGGDELSLSQCSVWYPEGLDLEPPGAQGSASDSIWPLWNWTFRTWSSIAGLEASDSVANQASTEMTPRPDILPSGHWKKTTLRNYLDNSKNEIVLVLSDHIRWSAWLSVFAALISASLFGRWPRLMFGTSILLWIGSIWLPQVLCLLCQQAFVGTALGAVLHLFYQTVSPMTASHLQTSKSDRSSTFAWCILPFGFLSLILMQPDPSFSQDPPDKGAKVFDILIPINPDGELAGTTIYVPDELLKAIEQDDRERRLRDSVGLLASSKHNLRLDSRTFGFGNADQPLTSTYEFWINDSAVGKAIRIPFPSESLKLSRFSVDGIEVLSGRLNKTDTELIWFPDRPGRRAVQIDCQVRMRSIENPGSSINPSNSGGLQGAEKRGSRVWGIATNVLPVGNAVLEVETDGAWWISVSAFGRSVNPAQGRTVIQLGNKSRIDGFFQPPSSATNRASTLAMPSDSSPSGGEFPTMNTELFLDNDQLLARTIVEFPSNLAIANEIEIESDSQWLPIGTQWGDAQLIDVRTGSTLDRKRYAVRWKSSETSGTETGSLNLPKRTITTIWIPVGDAGIRSILFAECRDRRVRQGVLRYARSPGSVWTLDGISSWIPAINSKDRLDWPELKDPPLTTNLRIPVSSGYGVLRRQSIESSRKLSASNRIHLESQKARLTTKLMLAGTLAMYSPLIFEIPSNYEVQKVLSSNGTLDFLTWVKDSKNYLQVLVDRQSSLIGELIIESKSNLPLGKSESIAFSWPELNSLMPWSSPTTMALSADPSWIISESDSNQTITKLLGQGDGKILLESRDATSNRALIRIERSESVWNGTLSIKSLQSESGQQVFQIAGLKDPSESGGWYGLELSIPRDLCSSWSSKNPVQELTSLRWNHKLLLIAPTKSDPSAESPSIDFLIELTPEQSSGLDLSAFKQIEIDGRKQERSIRVALGSTDEGGLLIGPAENLPIQESDQKSIGTEYQQRFAKHVRLAEELYLSSIWIERGSGFTSGGELVWNCPVGWICVRSNVNGESFPFRQEGDRVEVHCPAIESRANVNLWFRQSGEAAVSVSKDSLPTLEGTLSAGETLILNNPPDRSERQSELLFEHKAWTSMLRQPIPSSANASDGQWWRYGARELAQRMWTMSSVDFGESAEVLSSLPWTSREQYDQTIQSVLQTDQASGRVASNKANRMDPSTSRNIRITQTLLVLIVFAVFVWLWNRNKFWLQNRNWWNLLGIAGAWWLICADLWVPSFLALAATILVIDSYWMLSGQFRQNGTLSPR
jgi:hypothetical protein